MLLGYRGLTGVLMGVTRMLMGFTGVLLKKVYWSAEWDVTGVERELLGC